MAWANNGYSSYKSSIYFITENLDSLEALNKSRTTKNFIMNIKFLVVEGKKGKYNLDWNNIKVFENPIELNNFIQYSIQDSVSLLKAINKARNYYFDEYRVDLIKAVSTSSLSLLIYRTKFQKIEIPILKRNLDTKIRSSYFGGSSDYYIFYGKNLKFYDVNSLYSYAMLNEMPLIFLGEFNGDEFKIEDIFGFVECIIETPDNINNGEQIPLLIAKINGKICHPIGKWKGTYFSEEIKAVIKHGYKVKITKIYQFSKAKLFDDYVLHFYEKKKNSVVRSARWKIYF